MRKKAQTELKNAARNNQKTRGDHPTGQEGRQDRLPKHTSAAPENPQQSGKKHRVRFFPIMLYCPLSFTALARQNTHCCTAGVGNLRAQKSGKWVGLCLHGHHEKKTAALLYDTSLGYLNPMG